MRKTRKMAVATDVKKVRLLTGLKNSSKQTSVTTVVNELDYLGSRYRLRDLVSSDKGEDKDR